MSSRSSGRAPTVNGELFAECAANDECAWQPKIDIGETAAAYVFIAEMPGIDPQDIHIVYEDGLLKLDAKCLIEEREEWFTAIRVERCAGICHREFALPGDADISGRREALVRGLLTISLPKLSDDQPDADDGDSPQVTVKSDRGQQDPRKSRGRPGAAPPEANSRDRISA